MPANPLEESTFEELTETELPEETVEDTDDGGAIITMHEDTADAALEHFANIIDEIDPRTMANVSVKLLDLLEQDRLARKKRDELYEEGLRRTGLGDDAPGGANFQGASRTVHPLLTEACVDFSARAMKELFPPNGPVKSKILGDKDKEKVEKAQRKTDFMNWQTTKQIREFRSDLEKLLTQVPLAGGQYLKWMFNRVKKRPTVEFVPIDDILLPYAASNFYTADRRTHCQKITQEEFETRVRSGMYRDIILPVSPLPDETSAEKANDKIEGKERNTLNEDGLRLVYEIQVTLNLEEPDDEEADPRPYIISIDENSGEPLSVYRNWKEGDEAFQELQWMVEWPFVLWRGAYPVGLTHMIGGLTGAATGALRALLDSAHVQNMPSLLKLKNGVKGEAINMSENQVTELEGGMADDIRKLVMAVPYNPPSAVLFQLLGFLVDSGKGVVQTSFEALADMRADAPVGTTLALIEQGLVVFSAIHARLHAAMELSLDILHRINAAYLTTEDLALQYPGDIRPEDFDGPMDVIPVSDPNIFSDTQRLAQTQAILQRAQLRPDLYDHRKVEEMFIRQLKVSDDVLVKKEEPENMDPASENIAMSMGGMAYVLPHQNHLAHIQVLASFVVDPNFGGNPVIAQQFLPKAINHLRDHILHYYLQQTHLAVAEGAELTGDDAMKQAELITMVQHEASRLLAQVAQLMAQKGQELQQAMTPQPPPDPRLAVAQVNAQARSIDKDKELQFKAQELQVTAQLESQTAQQETMLKDKALMIDAQLESQKLEQAAAAEQARMQLDVTMKETDVAMETRRQKLEERRKELERAFNEQKLALDMEAEQLRLEVEQSMKDKDLQVRYQMNTDDNRTAKELAAAEIMSGEKVAVSTGTGINPNP